MFCYELAVTNRNLGEILDLSPGGLLRRGGGYIPHLLITVFYFAASPLTCFEVYFFVWTSRRAVDFSACVVDAVRAFDTVTSAMR